MTNKIDLNDYLHPKETALIGRENGETILASVQKRNGNFEELEQKHGSVIITIPERIVSMNKSFFLGFFELQVQRNGRDGFLKKYEIKTDDYITGKIDRYIDAALLKATQKDILDV